MNNPYFSLVATVWKYGKPWRYSIVGYYVAYIVAEASLSLGPYAFGRTIDALQNFVSVNEVVFWLFIGVAVVLVFWLFHGPARVIERQVALKIQQAFRLKLYQDLTHLPLKWHQNHHSGNIITRTHRAAMALYRFSGNQFIYIETIVKFIISVGFLLWVSAPLGMIILLVSFGIMTAVILFDEKLIPLYNAQNEIENHLGAVLFDYIHNMTTILTLRLGELTHSNLFQRMMMVWPFYKKDTVINEVKWFTMRILLSLVQAAVLIGYILHSFNTTGMVMIGLVVMVFRYQIELNHVFQDLSFHYSDLVHMNTDVKSIQPILNDIAQLTHLPVGTKIAQEWHTIDIKDLAFHHISKEQGQIFDDIHFTIKRGEKIALVGPSGGGKSTLLNLLCGLYSPTQIKLQIDGIAFDTLEPLQGITTLIPQDPEIFENTIAFNITMGIPTEIEEIQRIVKLAGFSGVLQGLPNGLETDIREKGLNLSVGQKQRLALARGLFAARFSSLILMDEPTSSVDLPTEKEILTGVIDAFPEAAVIVSLHRLHLLPKFDTVIMINKGTILASGPVYELLNNPGPVQDLWLSYQKNGT